MKTFTRGVHHLALCTDDMKKTVDFYVEVLGMPLVHAMKVPPGLGTGPVTAEIAARKAHAAAVSRRPTKVSEDRIAGGRLALIKMPVLPVQGGVPIMHQGECVGAVGVSGVQSHEDEIVCNAGIAAL